MEQLNSEPSPNEYNHLYERLMSDGSHFANPLHLYLGEVGENACEYEFPPGIHDQVMPPSIPSDVLIGCGIHPFFKEQSIITIEYTIGLPDAHLALSAYIFFGSKFAIAATTYEGYFDRRQPVTELFQNIMYNMSFFDVSGRLRPTPYAGLVRYVNLAFEQRWIVRGDD